MWGLSSVHKYGLNKGVKLARHKYTKDFVENAIEGCFTWAEVCRKIGIKPYTGAQTHLSKTAREHGIDTSHFKGKAHNKGRVLGRKTPIENYFNGTPIKSDTLRKRLIEEGIFDEKCSKCGVESWLGERAPLELDHKNGNPEDNRLENLQILCSNCHSIKTRLGRLSQLAEEAPLEGV